MCFMQLLRPRFSSFYYYTDKQQRHKKTGSISQGPRVCFTLWHGEDILTQLLPNLEWLHVVSSSY